MQVHICRFITQRARYRVQIWVLGVQIYSDITQQLITGSTTNCTAASVRGETTVKHGRINGGKLIISLIFLDLMTRKNIQPYWTTTCVITYIYNMYLYYTTHNISSANIAFESTYIFTRLCILSRPVDSTKYVRLVKISTLLMYMYKWYVLCI